MIFILEPTRKCKCDKMASDKSEVQISISSDTINSPERSTDFEIIDGDQDSSTNACDKNRLIVISDTELEEGEIGDDDDDCAVSDSEKKKVQTDYINEHYPNSKRKLSGESNVKTTKKKRRYEEISLEESFEDGVHMEEFAWSELRVLMVGDERVVAYNWEEWGDFPEQDLYHLPNCDLNSLCTLVEKHLYKEYDVVFLLAFHYDFICFEDDPDSDSDEFHKSSVIDLKSNININEIIKIVQKFHQKWGRQYPNTNIIWTLPSPPDFFKYNSIVLKERGIDAEKKLNRKMQNELSKDYFELSRKLAKEWKEKIKNIPMFPLNKVLFMKKHCYKRSFFMSGTPKFPRGFLRDGLYPTKMMAVYCAYLLVEYLIDEGFYPQNKSGLDLPEAEAKLVKLEPDTKNYVYSNDRYGSHHSRKRIRHIRHHSHRHKRHDSGSPRNSPFGSRSRSRSRRNRSWSSTRHCYKVRSRSRHRYRTRSRSRQRHRTRSRSRGRDRTGSRSYSRSVSKDRYYRKAHSKSKTRSHSKSKSHSYQHPRSSSSVSLPSSSSPESRNTDVTEPILNKTEKPVPEDAKKTNIKDEVSFWKTLRYLREVHDIQCVMYRRKPHTHPQFKNEKERFFKDFQHKPLGEHDLSKWDEYWKQRMEKIFEETWAAKKQQLTIDLNKKGTFTSLNTFTESNVNNGNKNSKEYSKDKTYLMNDNVDERSKFREENAETINSYLKDFETTVESLESSSFEKNRTTNNKKIDTADFTLADIFKDSPTKESDSDEVKDEEFTEKKLMINETVQGGDVLASPDTKPESYNMLPTFDPKSEEESSESSDSDLDVDGLMENADFLQGLEEIDRELQNAAPSEHKLEESVGETIRPSPKNDISSIFRDDVPKEKVFSDEDVKAEFVNVLKMLFRVSKRLGPLGLSVSALYHRASEDLRNKREKFSSLNSDSKSLLALVDKKLNILLNENLPQVQKAIYGEISERLQVLLDKIDVEHDKFSKVNIHSIAVATLGQEVSEVVSFIKNTLLYHGYTQFTSDDVMNIYMSVKASQLDMEKS